VDGVSCRRGSPPRRRARASSYQTNTTPPIDLAERVRFNPDLNKSWFGAVMKLIDQVTLFFWSSSQAG
jgi:hypothetical protein